jgi:hypothetical protein
MSQESERMMEPMMPTAMRGERTDWEAGPEVRLFSFGLSGL